jgi:D-sedoheptulose 7-phosphate isomerase
LATYSHTGLVQTHNHISLPVAHATDARSSLLSRQEALWSALNRLFGEASRLDAAADSLIDCLGSGGRVLVAGNGGSAAEAQHFATELVGRFRRERAPYAVLSLTADTAILTAVANDYGFDRVFARQVGAYGRPGDVLVGFSTSGRSINLVKAAETARDGGLAVIAITGEQPSPLADLADIAIRVPAVETPIVQELHTIVLHVLCDLVETALAAHEHDQKAVLP